MSGIIACAQFVCSVSQVPSKKEQIYKTQIEVRSVMIDAARHATIAKREISALIISLRRSLRSEIAPVNNENKSHGNLVVIVIPAISTGSRVSNAANNGNAVRNIPSPVHDDATDNHRDLKSRPSDLLFCRSLMVLRSTYELMVIA